MSTIADQLPNPSLGSRLRRWLSVFFGGASAGHRSDARDLDRADVLWLLTAYAFVLAPHAERQPWWFSVAIGVVLIWRGLITVNAWRFPPALVLSLIVLFAAIMTWRVHGRLWGRDPGVMLLLATLSMKLMEMRITRDVTWAIYLGLFLVVTNFFYSQSVFMALYAIICVGLFVATMIGFARLASKPTLRERVKPAIAMMVFAIPLTMILFFLFPRIQGPLWRMPDQSRIGKTGLSESMAPGNISELIKSEELAFNVKFESRAPSPAQLYWRGPVLSSFDGRRWTMDPLKTRALEGDYAALTGGSQRGIPVTYTMTLEPMESPWVTLLEIPEQQPPELRMNGDYMTVIFANNLERAAQAAQRRNVTVTSNLRYLLREPGGAIALSRYTMIPKAGNQRARELAQSWRTKHGTGRKADDDVIGDALTLFNKEFTYTLEPPQLQTSSPIDEFLFTTKLGFCEHYSSSFAYLMRSAGIPARVVTGYLGGEENPYNGTIAVRQSDAHAWTEVYLEGDGWVRVDPTSAVAPTRIQRGLSAQLGPLGMFGSLEANDPLGIVAWARLNWSAFNYQWTQWVINFNQDKQKDILSSLGFKNPDWQTMAQWMVGLGIGVTALGATVMVARLRPKRRDPLARLMDQLDARLAKAGLARAPAEGLENYSQRLRNLKPAIWERLDPLLRRLALVRYREPTESEIATLWHDIKALDLAR
jgi:protein-glutamine gamma-glutamyltransferase